MHSCKLLDNLVRGFLVRIVDTSEIQIGPKSMLIRLSNLGLIVFTNKKGFNVKLKVEIRIIDIERRIHSRMISRLY